MKMEDQEALDLLAACRQAEPEVVELALAVALAARVEQPLLRRARLLLCPRLDAGAESALWFSSIVSSRSASAFVIDHEILAHLRGELGQRPQSWLQLARDIVSAAHVQDPDALRLEEEIIWLAVKGGVSAAAEIDKRLRSAVKAMIKGADQGLEVARWADRALRSFPVTALETESAGLLAVGSAARLKTNSRVSDWGPLADLPQGVAWLLPGGSSAPTQIGFRLRHGELEVTPASAVLSQTLQLPGGGSEVLEIRWVAKGVSDQRAVSPSLNQRIPLPEDCREVEIRSSSGIVANLKVLDGATRGLRFSSDSEQNFRLMPSDMQTTAESAIQSISCSTGFSGIEFLGGYLYRDPLHRCDVWYRAGAASDTASLIQTLEILDIKPVYPRVFISYARSEKRWADTIARLLPKYFPGLEVWIDQQQLRDEPWAEAIEKALLKSTAAVVLVSPVYLSSELSSREASRLLDLAKRQHLAVFTIRVTDSLESKESTELLQYQFLASESLDQIGQDASAIEHFVETLAQALRKHESRFSTPSVVEPSPDGTIYISYATEDIGASKRLLADLQAMGGDVAWFDNSALKEGDKWDDQVRNAIEQCSVFLPLISSNTEQRTEGFFFREWNEAATRSLKIQTGRKFIFPIVIDTDYDGNMNRYANVPEMFKAVQWGAAPAGQMPDDLKVELRKQLRSLRRPKVSGEQPETQAAFLTYARDDSEFAIRLAKDLKSAGANVWFDQLDIEAGEPWAKAVESALSNSPRMLIVLSPSSVKSRNVLDEISYALGNRKSVIPVMYLDCAIPSRLAKLHFVDFRNDYAGGLNKLLKTLASDQAVDRSEPKPSTVPNESRPSLSDVDEHQESLTREQRRTSGGFKRPLVPPLRLFLSYSHRDEELCERFLVHLSQLKRDGLIEAWHDRRITAGSEWGGIIDENLNSAHIIILLVSADFLASDYSNGLEMTRALARSKLGEASVVTLILRPCDWMTSRVGVLQALPRNGRPVVDWPTVDHGFVDAVQGLRRLINELCQSVSVEVPKTKKQSFWRRIFGSSEVDRGGSSGSSTTSSE